MNRVFIRRILLPGKVEGIILEDNNGDYNIYLNERLASNKVLPVLMHELRHGAENHLHDDSMTVEDKEAEAQQ